MRKEFECSQSQLTILNQIFQSRHRLPRASLLLPHIELALIKVFANLCWPGPTPCPKYGRSRPLNRSCSIKHFRCRVPQLEVQRIICRNYMKCQSSEAVPLGITGFESASYQLPIPSLINTKDTRTIINKIMARTQKAAEGQGRPKAKLSEGTHQNGQNRCGATYKPSESCSDSQPSSPETRSNRRADADQKSKAIQKQQRQVKCNYSSCKQRWRVFRHDSRVKHLKHKHGLSHASAKKLMATRHDLIVPVIDIIDDEALHVESPLSQKAEHRGQQIKEDQAASFLKEGQHQQIQSSFSSRRRSPRLNKPDTYSSKSMQDITQDEPNQEPVSTPTINRPYFVKGIQASFQDGKCRNKILDKSQDYSNSGFFQQQTFPSQDFSNSGAHSQKIEFILKEQCQAIPGCLKQSCWEQPPRLDQLNHQEGRIDMIEAFGNNQIVKQESGFASVDQLCKREAEINLTGKEEDLANPATSTAAFHLGINQGLDLLQLLAESDSLQATPGKRDQHLAGFLDVLKVQAQVLLVLARLQPYAGLRNLNQERPTFCSEMGGSYGKDPATLEVKTEAAVDDIQNTESQHKSPKPQILTSQLEGASLNGNLEQRLTNFSGPFFHNQQSPNISKKPATPKAAESNQAEAAEKEKLEDQNGVISIQISPSQLQQIDSEMADDFLDSTKKYDEALQGLQRYECKGPSASSNESQSDDLVGHTGKGQHSFNKNELQLQTGGDPHQNLQTNPIKEAQWHESARSEKPSKILQSTTKGSDTTMRRIVFSPPPKRRGTESKANGRPVQAHFNQCKTPLSHQTKTEFNLTNLQLQESKLSASLKKAQQLDDDSQLPPNALLPVKKSPRKVAIPSDLRAIPQTKEDLQFLNRATHCIQGLVRVQKLDELFLKARRAREVAITKNGRFQDEHDWFYDEAYELCYHSAGLISFLQECVLIRMRDTRYRRTYTWKVSTSADPRVVEQFNHEYAMIRSGMDLSEITVIPEELGLISHGLGCILTMPSLEQYQTLEDLIFYRPASVPVEYHDRFKICSQLLRHFAKLHNRGYFHNDLTLRNILVKKQKLGIDIKVVDWRHASQIGTNSSVSSLPTCNLLLQECMPEIIQRVSNLTLTESVSTPISGLQLMITSSAHFDLSALSTICILLSDNEAAHPLLWQEVTSGKPLMSPRRILELCQNLSFVGKSTLSEAISFLETTPQKSNGYLKTALTRLQQVYHKELSEWREQREILQ